MQQLHQEYMQYGYVLCIDNTQTRQNYVIAIATAIALADSGRPVGATGAATMRMHCEMLATGLTFCGSEIRRNDWM